MEDTRIAVLSIIVEDSESTAKLNEMIHDYAEYVVGRMGIPYREKNISIISLVIDAPQTKISELSGQDWTTFWSDGESCLCKSVIKGKKYD